MTNFRSGRKNKNAPYWVMMRKAEADIILWALKEADYNVGRAATMIGLTESLLYGRIKYLDLDYPGRTRRRSNVKKSKMEEPAPKKAEKSDPQPLDLKVVRVNAHDEAPTE